MSSFIPVSIVKDWNLETYKTQTPFNNKAFNGSETKINKALDKSNKKTIKIILRNKSESGNELKNTLANTSISKPKYWPSRGLTES